MQRVTVTEQDHNSELRLKVGDDLIVRLEAIPGAGFFWSVTGEEGSVLSRPVEPRFERSDAPKLGGAEQQIFTFHVQSAGVRSLRLEYRRPWEKQIPPTRTFSVHIIAEE